MHACMHRCLLACWRAGVLACCSLFVSLFGSEFDAQVCSSVCASLLCFGVCVCVSGISAACGLRWKCIELGSEPRNPTHYRHSGSNLSPQVPKPTTKTPEGIRV